MLRYHSLPSKKPVHFTSECDRVPFRNLLLASTSPHDHTTNHRRQSQQLSPSLVAAFRLIIGQPEKRRWQRERFHGEGCSVNRDESKSYYREKATAWCGCREGELGWAVAFSFLLFA
jgi:hypothetical protein